MKYPTLDEVEKADIVMLCRWHRFLRSPGISALDDGTDDFEARMVIEKPIMDRIEQRVKEQGGFTPAISKEIGWIPAR